MGLSEASMREFWQQIEGYDDNYSRFNDKQLNKSQKSVQSLLKRQLDEPGCPITRALVTGRAGTGKSSLINKMCKMIDAKRGFEPRKRHQALAYTNAAARVIQGKTIHKFLLIPYDDRPFVELRGDKLGSLQNRLQYVQFIFIDNCSLIGNELFDKINSRLCQASGSSEPFGGYFFYFFGGPTQLKPVLDEQPGWLDFKIFSHEEFELNIVYRQPYDEEKFKQLLVQFYNRRPLRIEERRLFESRHVDNLPKKVVDSFLDDIHLFPENKQVYVHNSRLQETKEQLGLTMSVETADSDRNGNKIELAIWEGCRIMLTDDVYVERGLGKHSIGVVKNIIEFESSPVLLVQFDNYSGPTMDEVVPIKEALGGGLPIMLAQSITFHKAQGLHFGRVVINYINSLKDWREMTYVAMSRVRRIEDILIRGDIPEILLSADVARLF